MAISKIISVVQRFLATMIQLFLVAIQKRMNAVVSMIKSSLMRNNCNHFINAVQMINTD
jgi:hypothetical protein